MRHHDTLAGHALGIGEIPKNWPAGIRETWTARCSGDPDSYGEAWRGKDNRETMSSQTRSRHRGPTLSTM
jgi:hypothetical protein